MKEFLKYFFGKGEEIEFTNFSLAHFLPIILMIAVIICFKVFEDKIRNYKNERIFRYIIAFGLEFIGTVGTNECHPP